MKDGLSRERSSAKVEWEPFLPQRKEIRLGGDAWLLNGSVILQTSMAASKRNI